MKRILTVIIAAAAAISLCSAQDISPNITVKDLSGDTVLMSDVLKDDVVIVSFWATWCKPCQNELDALAEIEDTWADRLRVVYTDENSELAKSLNINSIPFVMIIVGGETVYSHTGYTPGSERLLVEKALGYVKQGSF